MFKSNLFKLRKNRRYNYTPRYFDGKEVNNVYDFDSKFSKYRETYNRNDFDNNGKVNVWKCVFTVTDIFL